MSLHGVLFGVFHREASNNAKGTARNASAKIFAAYSLKITGG